MNNVPPDPAPLFAPFLARAEAAEAEAASLRAALAAEREAHATTRRERDAFRAQAEASLVVPCACGRPMPSVSSRLRCDACRAEAERDEARAAVVAMRVFVADSAPHKCEHVSDGVTYLWWTCQTCREPHPDDGARIDHLHNCLWWRARNMLAASDAGAPLLAELRALRAEVARLSEIERLSKAVVTASVTARAVKAPGEWKTLVAMAGEEEAAIDALRAALDAAKAGE